jgi:hypothetical protein
MGNVLLQCQPLGSHDWLYLCLFNKVFYSTYLHFEDWIRGGRGEAMPCHRSNHPARYSLQEKSAASERAVQKERNNNPRLLPFYDDQLQ